MNTERSVSIECGKCGEIHKACAAHNRANKPCGREPSPYQRVCTMHGSASPQALQAAARREASAIVVQTYDADPEAILAAQGMEPIADPLLELSKLAASSRHFMDALGARVNALEDIRRTAKDGSEQLASEIALFERAQDRTAKLLKMLIDAGFEGRRVKLEEGTAVAFTQVMRAVLDRLDLTPEQREVVPGIVVEELGKLEER